MEAILEHVLYPAGISNRYRGYPYFLMAVRLAAEDLGKLSNIQKEIYLPIARHYQTNTINVERDIRTIRDVFMRNAGTGLLLELTDGHYRPAGQPYPAELIEIFAKYYRKKLLMKEKQTI